MRLWETDGFPDIIRLCLAGRWPHDFVVNWPMSLFGSNHFMASSFYTGSSLDGPRGERIFHYALSLRISIIASALVCLIMAVVSLTLPLTPAFRPVVPNLSVVGILVSILVFLPLSGYFILRCIHFHDRLGVDGDGITLYSWFTRCRIRFDAVVSVSVASGHELVLLCKAPSREVVIETRYLDEGGDVFTQIVLAGLSEVVERQNKAWDAGEMICERSPQDLREAWYLVAVANGITAVVGGSLIWQFYMNPIVVAVTLAVLALVLALSVVIHQHRFCRRYVLGEQGLIVWTAFGAEFVDFESIDGILFRRWHAHGARHTEATIRAGRRAWRLHSGMRNFDGFVDRLIRRAEGTPIHGGLPMNSRERESALRRRDVVSASGWCVTCWALGGVLIVWGLFMFHERRALIENGAEAQGKVIERLQEGHSYLVRYEFEAELTGGRGILRGFGEARVPRSVYLTSVVDSEVAVYYDPSSPGRNLTPSDMTYRFVWIVIVAGGAFALYGLYQFRRLYLAMGTGGLPSHSHRSA